MKNIPIVDNIDCFAERFEGVSLHTLRFNKAEFEECTFASCDFSQTFFMGVGLLIVTLKTAILVR